MGPLNRLTKPRVVVADDDRCMLSAIERALGTWCDVELVGRALDGVQAVDATLRLQPDILILDIVMPHLDGIQVARKLRKANSPAKIIFLTALEDSSTEKAAMEAGGQAYVSKFQVITDLPRAIVAVMEGATFLSSADKRR